MVLQMLVQSTGEMWLLGVLFLIGAGFILFGKGVESILAGIVAIGGVVSIGYMNHTQHQQERMIVRAFNEGRVLECGLFRGQSFKVDSSKGWVREDGVGFVKGDTIINDVGVCRVIGLAPKEPSMVSYWMFFVSVMGILMILRAVIMGSGKGDHDIQDE